MKARKIVIPPEGFIDYEWDDDFKLMMFCLDFTRNEMSRGLPSEPHEAQEQIEEWGYKSASDIYDALWGRFKYFKGSAFDKKFKIVESNVDCPRCKNQIRMVEVKPIKIVAREANHRERFNAFLRKIEVIK